jgi:hypothetical protein
VRFLRRLAILVVSAVVAGKGARFDAAATPPCEFDGASRIVAIGDAHGAYDPFLEILRAAGLVDSKKKWIGGTTHLVQTGDVLDRGPDSRKILDLLRALTPQAAAAGGAVHELLGNHEEMRMVSDFRYTSPREISAFATANSQALREQASEAAPPESRSGLLAAPLGMIEMVRAFAPTGEYGAYLRQLPAVVRINGILFLHGGLSPADASRTCTEINEEVRRDLTEDLAQTRAAQATTLVGRADGPLWYRGLAQEPETFAPEVQAILAAQKARAMVVGHTGAPHERVTMRFGGRVFLIDTGMNSEYVSGGRPSALEIAAGVFTAIYLDGRVVLTPEAGGHAAQYAARARQTRTPR